jgi:hypothetical protein
MDHGPDDEMDEDYASIYRAFADDRVWMCNIPYIDVADGIQASTSARRLKAYLEEYCPENGTWVRVEGGWEYHWPRGGEILGTPRSAGGGQ